MNPTTLQRRVFLKRTLLGGIAAATATRFGRTALAAEEAPAESASPSARVALTTGDQRADIAFRALKSLDKEIADDIANRRVIIKPNLVSSRNQLASTHAEHLEGVLEFLKSIGKLENAIIAESSAENTVAGFSNFGYTPLAEKYGLKLVDLDQEDYKVVMAFDQSDVRPHPVRVSSLLLDQKNNYIISATKMKTHNYAVVTLSLKNIILGAPLKLPGPSLSPVGPAAPNAFGAMGGGMGGRGGGRSRMGGMGRGMSSNDKPIMHGGGSYGINLNLAMLAPQLHPSLAVIDGYDGMEGNGPISGTPVDHRVCVVGTDWLAADRVGVELMGIGFENVGYLNYLVGSGLGETDLEKIEIVGEAIADHRKTYQLGSRIESQLEWKNPAQITPRTENQAYGRG